MKFFISLLVAFPLNLFAITLDLFHTNDLHSYMEDIGTDHNLGGYPALKAHLDLEKAHSEKLGHYSIRLNAGDFAEGNIFYWSQQGLRSFQAMDLLENDAVTIGNHDWLMGPEELEQLFKIHTMLSPILGANVFVDPLMPNFKNNITPYRIFSYGYIKVGVIGLTNKEVLYSWILPSKTILDPLKAAKQWALYLKNEKHVDYIILLTHTGTRVDRKLAQDVSNVDLIVGGHSHDLYMEPLWEKNKKTGQLVPIVQVGKFGEYYGKMQLDLVKGQPLKINQYQVLPVTHEVSDPYLTAFVANAKNEYEDLFGRSWLEEVIGRSDIPLEIPTRAPTVWGDIITESVRTVMDADIAINVSTFMGHTHPAGNITRQTIIESYPRTFELADPYGWRIYDVSVQGWVISLVSEVVLKWELPLYLAGLDFELEQKPDGTYKVKNVRINGERIHPLKLYRVAITEGIVRGGFGITSWVGALLRKVWRSPYTVWEAMEREVRHIGVITKDYGRHKGIYRTMVVPVREEIHGKSQLKFDFFRMSPQEEGQIK